MDPGRVGLGSGDEKYLPKVLPLILGKSEGVQASGDAGREVHHEGAGVSKPGCRFRLVPGSLPVWGWGVGGDAGHRQHRSGVIIGDQVGWNAGISQQQGCDQPGSVSASAAVDHDPGFGGGDGE